MINADCLDRETCSAVFFFVQKRNCPGGQPLWGIVLNSEQMGCNPAAVFKLYPVIAVSSAVDAFAICVADVAFVQVVPFAIIRARGSCDNCDMPKKANKFKGFWGIVLFRTCIRDPELAVKKGTAR